MTTTQNCAECGTRAEPGQSFCDACGAVLGWTDRAGARTGAAASGGAAEEGGAADGAGASGSGATAGSRASAEDPYGESAGAYAGAGAGAGAGADAGSSSSSGAANSAAASGSSASGPAPEGGPGWDAFTRADGGAGLARTPRDRLGAEPSTAGAASPSGTASGVVDPASAAPSLPHRTPAAGAVPGVPGTPPPAASDPNDRPTTVTGSGAGSGSANRPADETAPTEPVPYAAAHAQDPGGAGGVGGAGGSGGEDLSDRARQLLVPVSDPDPRPATPSVAPVLPGRPVPQRPQTVRAPGQDLGTGGGIPCPWCSTPNHPDRHYCTRCAMPMAGGDHHAPLQRPWWRRLFDWRRGGEMPWAGDRPRLRRTFDRVLSLFGYAVVLALVILAIIYVPKGVQATRDHFAKRAQAIPDTYSASRSFVGHKPQLAFDLKSNTWWGPGVAESGAGEWIEAKWQEPTRLLNVIITPGESSHADQIGNSALPHRLKATITMDDGKVVNRDLVLDSGAGPQTLDFRAADVVKVRLTIESAYNTSAKKQVAIAEIEFFGKSNNN
ncbi:hypothetical protein OK074_7785 [Actinobacteria bacterium OK074]|nr:hypothetical protein OK074_7785 [Actinobacteria bacterium OK074]